MNCLLSNMEPEVSKLVNEYALLSKDQWLTFWGLINYRHRYNHSFPASDKQFLLTFLARFQVMFSQLKDSTYYLLNKRGLNFQFNHSYVLGIYNLNFFDVNLFCYIMSRLRNCVESAMIFYLKKGRYTDAEDLFPSCCTKTFCYFFICPQVTKWSKTVLRESFCLVLQCWVNYLWQCK